MLKRVDSAESEFPNGRANPPVSAQNVPVTQTILQLNTKKRASTEPTVKRKSNEKPVKPAIAPAKISNLNNDQA